MVERRFCYLCRISRHKRGKISEFMKYMNWLFYCWMTFLQIWLWLGIKYRLNLISEWSISLSSVNCTTCSVSTLWRHPDPLIFQWLLQLKSVECLTPFHTIKVLLIPQHIGISAHSLLYVNAFLPSKDRVSFAWPLISLGWTRSIEVSLAISTPGNSIIIMS